MRLCELGEHRSAVAMLTEALALLRGIADDRDRVTTGEEAREYTMIVADVWGQLGVCYQSIADVGAALQAYRTAVEVDVTSHACHANLAVLYGLRNEHAKAAEHIRLALVYDPDNASYAQVQQQLPS